MRLPFLVYKLYTGIELVECEAILDSNPVHSCKFNDTVLRTGEISRRNTINGLVHIDTGRKSKTTK